MDATPDRDEKPRTESFDAHAALMKDAYSATSAPDAHKELYTQLDHPLRTLAASGSGGLVVGLGLSITTQMREWERAKAALDLEGISALKSQALTNTQVALSEKFLGSPLAVGAATGAAAALAAASLDLLLQKELGNKIGGHDLFAVSSTELFGMGMVAALPLEPKMKLLAFGAAWTAGRIENYFDN